jgi:hypothetical protein
MARINAKGRRRDAQPFVMLEWWIFDSPAYRSLHPVARALLWETVRRYNGKNNGSIGLGQREAATASGVKRADTVARYFAELEAKGFIAATRRGGFNLKDPSSRRATEWRLTWLDSPGLGPSKEFMRWTSNPAGDANN